MDVDWWRKILVLELAEPEPSEPEFETEPLEPEPDRPKLNRTEPSRGFHDPCDL